MTLMQVYPYWIMGQVPTEDLPYIACNDMLAGNMDDVIVALAALSQPDPWELDPLLARAFARLGLPPMTAREAAKRVALDRMQELARRLVSREVDPLRGANAIYRCAADAGLFEDDGDVDPQVAEYGSDFLQLADALEVRQEHSNQKRQFEELIIEAAGALLAGQPTPAWYSDATGDLHRGRPPWATSSVSLRDEDQPS